MDPYVRYKGREVRLRYRLRDVEELDNWCRRTYGVGLDGLQNMPIALASRTLYYAMRAEMPDLDPETFLDDVPPEEIRPMLEAGAQALENFFRAFAGESAERVEKKRSPMRSSSS